MASFKRAARISMHISSQPTVTGQCAHEYKQSKHRVHGALPVNLMGVGVCGRVCEKDTETAATNGSGHWRTACLRCFDTEVFEHSSERKRERKFHFFFHLVVEPRRARNKKKQ